MSDYTLHSNPDDSAPASKAAKHDPRAPLEQQDMSQVDLGALTKYLDGVGITLENILPRGESPGGSAFYLMVVFDPETWRFALTTNADDDDVLAICSHVSRQKGEPS